MLPNLNILVQQLDKNSELLSQLMTLLRELNETVKQQNKLIAEQNANRQTVYAYIPSTAAAGTSNVTGAVITGTVPLTTNTTWIVK